MAVSVRAGLNRHRITIQEKGSPARDTHGGEVITWNTVATVWAEVLPLTGRELFDAQQDQGEALFRFRIRYRTDVTKDMQVVWRTRMFQIVGPPTNVEGRDRVIEILGREIT